MSADGPPSHDVAGAYGPAQFWPQVEAVPVELGLTRWPNPPIDEQNDRSYAYAEGDVTAVLMRFWYPYPGHWRTRMEVQIRHAPIEDVLDSYYETTGTASLASWRPTLTMSANLVLLPTGPTTVLSEPDLEEVARCTRDAYERLPSMARSVRELKSLFTLLTRFRAVEKVVAAHLLLGNEPRAHAYLDDLSRAPRPSTIDRYDSIRRWLDER